MTVAPKYSLMSERAVPGEGVALTRQQTPNNAFRPCKVSHKIVARTRDLHQGLQWKIKSLGNKSHFNPVPQAAKM